MIDNEPIPKLFVYSFESDYVGLVNRYRIPDNNKIVKK